MASAKNLFSASQARQIATVIKSAEENTSGEIRVHIENRCTQDAIECAVKVFQKLGMHNTKLRNGVMIYLAVKDQKFAIIGDEGINKHVPETFWDKVRGKMLEHFSHQRFTEGICEGIEMTGKELKKYFPLSVSDKNELSNEVTFGAK